MRLELAHDAFEQYLVLGRIIRRAHGRFSDDDHSPRQLSSAILRFGDPPVDLLR